jgi:hypothetical protein
MRGEDQKKNMQDYETAIEALRSWGQRNRA